MTASRHHGWLAVGLPVLAGVALLAGGWLLLPDRQEVLHAERRAQPAAMASLSVPPPAAPSAPTALTRPMTLPPAPPSIAALIATGDAATLAALTSQVIASGQQVTTLQVAYDLVAAKRPAVALAYLAARSDGSTATTWRLRVDLLRTSGRTSEAAALVSASANARSGVAPTDLIAAAYAIDRADLVITAAARGAIPPPDATLALDLARRADKAGRGDLIVLLDRATKADWRGADPWLAIRVATRNKDTVAALHAAALLPPDQRGAAQEMILTAAGDRDGMRRLLLARATQPGMRAETIAEQLLAAGYRDDAEAVLRRAASGQPVTNTATQRLLYLMGPRPTGDDLAWLQQQAMRGSVAEQVAWIDLYAQRDRAAQALAFLSRHPLGDRTEVMLTRLSLARAAGDQATGRKLASGLLDGRPLQPAQLRALSAAVPSEGDATGTIAKRRIAAGVAEPRDAIDLAWAAWNAGDAAETQRWLRDHLARTPDDLPALRLMADAQARTGGAAAARPWLERALARTPTDSRGRAELLNRLGRRAEAVAVVEALRADAPQDRSLAALHARLLIAQGQPGRARAVLGQ